MTEKDLGTVSELIEEIERLRAGGDSESVEGTTPTAGQLWHKLLDLDKGKRIEILTSLIDASQRGSQCTLRMHEEDLNEQHLKISQMWNERVRWNSARRLIAAYIGNLRQEQQTSIEQGTVADRLELFLKAGKESPVENPGRVLCGHQWTESGRQLKCAEPVDGSGLHQGEHCAYVREGESAEEELRMKYLEEENSELRRRLGLPPNKKRV